jgi:hypothetical protein
MNFKDIQTPDDLWDYWVSNGKPEFDTIQNKFKESNEDLTPKDLHKKALMNSHEQRCQKQKTYQQMIASVGGTPDFKEWLTEQNETRMAYKNYAEDLEIVSFHSFTQHMKERVYPLRTRGSNYKVITTDSL